MKAVQGIVSAMFVDMWMVHLMIWAVNMVRSF